MVMGQAMVRDLLIAAYAASGIFMVASLLHAAHQAKPVWPGWPRRFHLLRWWR